MKSKSMQTNRMKLSEGEVDDDDNSGPKPELNAAACACPGTARSQAVGVCCCGQVNAAAVTAPKFESLLLSAVIDDADVATALTVLVPRSVPIDDDSVNVGGGCSLPVALPNSASDSRSKLSPLSSVCVA